ncbi:hypothetical protein PsorP6_003589 [Peronosclerospora sorghi]|uniref:Uncharacterized protein n=1 Tax=Peronosclerospora sorghi TaxID=230839 RepID=A0ACC0VMY3_9STRA|nr:hypothetical protein PsorP6_003589 [Peronosclerospora sorghi]
MLLQMSEDGQFLAIQRSDVEVQVVHIGLEHYRVSSKRRNCVLCRQFGLYVHALWYADSHGVLLFSSGSGEKEIVPFLL